MHDDTGRPFLEEGERYATEMHLATSMGLSLDLFVDIFGTSWSVRSSDVVNLDADPSGVGLIFGPWFESGDPVQLLLRPRDFGVELAVPLGRWNGGHPQLPRPDSQRSLLLDEWDDDVARATVRDLLTMRRRTFRYCRYCKSLLAPEDGQADACWGCANPADPTPVY